MVFVKIYLESRIIFVEKGSIPNCSHVCNVVKTNYGKEFICDLQNDLENIQSRARTYCFGIYVGSGEHINNKILEEIDKKIGYIDNDNYYADDYKYLINNHSGMFDNFFEKINFILKNIEPYNNKMEYAERRWRHERLLRRFLNQHEFNKIKIIDGYTEIENGKRKYKLCISVSNGEDTKMYMFSDERIRYEQIAMLDFCNMIRNNELNTLQKVPKLRHYMRILKEQDSEDKLGIDYI